MFTPSSPITILQSESQESIHRSNRAAKIMSTGFKIKRILGPNSVRAQPATWIPINFTQSKRATQVTIWLNNVASSCRVTVARSLQHKSIRLTFDLPPGESYRTKTSQTIITSHQAATATLGKAKQNQHNQHTWRHRSSENESKRDTSWRTLQFWASIYCSKRERRSSKSRLSGRLKFCWTVLILAPIYSKSKRSWHTGCVCVCECNNCGQCSR